MTRFRLLGLWLLLALPANMAVAGSVDIAGLARTCAGCHGPEGAGPGRTIPSIAGLRAKHFGDAMRGYRQGSRSFYVMRFIAKGLDDDEIDKLSIHFARLPFSPSRAPTDPAFAGKGALLAKSCNACHGADGRGADKGPRLAGQPVEYLNGALAAYLSGERRGTGDMMAQLKPLSAADRLHLSHFYASRQ